MYNDSPVNYSLYDNTASRKGGRKFTRKASGAAAIKRAATKRRNIRARSAK